LQKLNLNGPKVTRNFNDSDDDIPNSILGKQKIQFFFLGIEFRKLSSFQCFVVWIYIYIFFFNFIVLTGKRKVRLDDSDDCEINPLAPVNDDARWLILTIVMCICYCVIWVWCDYFLWNTYMDAKHVPDM
jgi:hypothetical protein